MHVEYIIVLDFSLPVGLIHINLGIIYIDFLRVINCDL